ncbi:MAG TPA: SH3 domain-containing protein [Rhodobacteraceae bacterium]|nr:SH3 domain-containing protein [Paracoccaceae bacterium]
MNRRSFLISAAAFGASVAAAGTAQAGGATRIVDAPWGLNMRAGPGTEYHVIKSLPHGSHVTKIKKHGGWVKVHLASGHAGWVSGQYLKKPHGGGGGYAVWAVVQSYDGCLNLRTGPGSGYQIIKVMNNGEKVEILASSGKWRKVRHKRSGKVGWAHGAYLVS